MQFAVAVFALARFVGIEARRHHDRAHTDIDRLWLVLEHDLLAVHLERVVEVIVPIHCGNGGIAARIRAVDHLAFAHAIVELIWHQPLAGGNQRIGIFLIGAARVLENPHAIIADVARHAFDFRLGVDRDVRMRDHLLDQRVQQRARVLARREDRLQLRHASAQEGGLFDQHDVQTLTGDVQRGAQSRHASADDQSLFLGFESNRFERLEMTRLGDARSHQVHGFAGRAVAVAGMYPRVLLAQADVMIQVRIQSRAHDGAAESRFMERRSARADDDAVDAQFFDILLDLRLPRIGTQRHIGARNDHIGLGFHHLCHLFAFDGVADVPATIAGIHADLKFLRHMPPPVVPRQSPFFLECKQRRQSRQNPP